MGLPECEHQWCKEVATGRWNCFVCDAWTLEAPSTCQQSRESDQQESREDDQA